MAAFAAPLVLPPTCRKNTQSSTFRMEAAPPSSPPAARKRGVRVPSFKKLQERQAKLAAQAVEARKAAELQARRNRINQRNSRRGQGTPLEALHVGAELNGVVNNLVRHGAYVDIGATRDGLVHVRDMGVHFVHEPSDVVEPGSRVTVWVKYVNPETNTLGLTMRRPITSKNSISSSQLRRKVADYQRGMRLQGVVERITNFGAYIDVGAVCPAFLHVRNLWGRRPRETLDTLILGRDIWVVVTDIDEVRNYLTVSARGCNLLPIDEYGNVVLDAPARNPSEPNNGESNVTLDMVLRRPGDSQNKQQSNTNSQNATEQAMNLLGQKCRDEMLVNEFGMVTQTDEWDDIRHMFDSDTEFDLHSTDDHESVKNDSDFVGNENL